MAYCNWHVCDRDENRLQNASQVFLPAMDGRLKLGWLRGLEPPTTGITIQDSNQLSYSHHCNARTWHDHPWNHFGRVLRVPVVATVMARPAGIEPATAGLEGRCSIRLSYGRPVRMSHRYEGRKTGRWSG